MDKLELRHVLSYLPDLKIKWDDTGDIYGVTLESSTDYDEMLYPISVISFCIDVQPKPLGFKLIIRPLSDLTKEIEVNGEKVVPYDKFKDVVSFDQWTKVCNTIDVDGGEYSKISDMPYWWVNLAIQFHFDIWGLIPAGLAIDINTIKP